jgi:hypothetical protein
MTQTPSSGGSATPTTGSPATGTPAAGSATPQPATLTLEEALKQIAELKQHAQNKESEAAHHGKKLSAAEKELEAYKAAEEAAKAAQMSELEKAQKRAADLEEQQERLAAELYEARVRDQVASVMGKFNFIDGVSSRTIANLLLVDDDAIEFENGQPTNIEKLLEKLVKAEPGLVKPTPTQPGQMQQRMVPSTPAMNPGRTSIAPGAIPGRIPRLEDIEWKR